MATQPRIVVGIDGSDASAVALDWALAAAVRRGAMLEVVHTWTARPTVAAIGVPTLTDPGAAEACAKETLDEMVDAALVRAPVRPVDVRRMLVQGAASNALVAQSVEASQLVVGSHALGPVSSAVLGSVSTFCANHASVPVTVVPHQRGDRHEDGPVVVGVDREEISLAAIRWAASEAAARDADLLVVHAYALIPEVYGAVVTAGQRADAEALLHDVTSAAFERGAPRVAHIDLLPLVGGPGRTLVEAAAAASELVVGAGRHRGLRRLVGSVSRHCLHHAPCPVTIIREV